MSPSVLSSFIVDSTLNCTITHAVPMSMVLSATVLINTQTIVAWVSLEDQEYAYCVDKQHWKACIVQCV